MDKFLTKYQKIIAKFVVKIILIVLLITLVTGAFFVGFAIDFKSCFGKATCSGPGATGANYLLFPAIILLIAGILYVYFRKRKQAAYHQSIAQGALEEAGLPILSSDEQHTQSVRAVLEQSGPLSVEAIREKTALSEEVTFATLRALLEQGAVSQQIDKNSSAVFYLKK